MRVKGGLQAKKRHKKYLALAKGYRAGRRVLYRSAREGVERALCFAFRDRKARKRELRSLWITRISAACKELGLSYSRLIDYTKKANILIDRKMLSELAIADPKAFAGLVESAKTATAQAGA
ncbi:MAG: 50S ribosomal protein L20 [Deltaproteobacteria bacterium]|jgi:large subunit ribosomal protein L20|nr:50S ribosomal protein L20 [Deltaproteobacteria bacterium]